MKSRHLPSEDGGLSDHQVLGHLAVVASKMWIACCDPQKKCALWNPYALPSREVAFTWPGTTLHSSTHATRNRTVGTDVHGIRLARMMAIRLE